MGRLRSINLELDIEQPNVEQFEQTKSALHEQIKELQADLEGLKNRRKHLKRHITISELPEEKRLLNLPQKAST